MNLYSNLCLYLGLMGKVAGSINVSAPELFLFQTIPDKLKMIQIGYQTGQSHVSVFALPKSVSQVADSTHSWQC